MSKIQAGKPVPKISARDEVILEATDVFLRAEKYMGIAAVVALSSFAEQLHNKTLTIRAARKILDDKTLFSELLVKADQNYWDGVNKQVREREHKDLAVIKDNTAKKATIITAAAFCVLSPIVTYAEQFLADGAKAASHALFGSTKKNVTQPLSTEKPKELPAEKPKELSAEKPKELAPATSNVSDQKTVVLQFCKLGLCDVTTGKLPQLSGKEKLIVIVSVNSHPLPRPVHRKHSHHRLKHSIH